jgi:hypothetical protein
VLVSLRPAAQCRCVPVNSDVKHQSPMPAISRAIATLRVIGSDLNPEEISSLLGGLPTRAHRKGDDLRKSPDAPVRSATAGLWAVEAQLATPSNVNRQIVDLLNGLTDDLLVWKRIATRYRLGVYCVWFMEEGNEGEEISAETLHMLSARGISLDFDIYTPDA